MTRRYFEDARAAGTATGAGWFRGAAGSRAQGTWVQFDLQVRADGARSILGARFLAFGCPHVIAVCQWLAEHAIGLAADPRLPESVPSLRARFEIPAEKLGRILVVEDAWAAALHRNA